MSDYPLSTISSKKIKISAHSVFEKSACQTVMPNVVDKADYCHILRKQFVFIELYYQGKIMETAYNQWITFMGGTLYKRLNPKVTLFLTNTETNELNNIMDRVKRTCPNCKVVNILWFQECFQAKEKIPFDDYLLSTQKVNESQKDKQQENKIQLLKIEGFLNNISQDIEVEYQQFFKKRQNVAFQVAAKNHNYKDPELLRGREIDLGPNPNKKKNLKPEVNGNTANKKKRLIRNTIKQITNKQIRNESLQPKQVEQSDETKSMDKQLNKNKEYPQQQQIFPKEQGNNQSLTFEQQKIINLNEMMEKYLQRTENSKSSGRREISKISGNSKEVVVHNSSSESQCISSNQFQDQGKKRIKQSKLSLRQPKNAETTFSHLSHTPRYKQAIKRKQVTQIQLYAEIQLLKIDLVRQVPNRLIVVTDSKTVQSKIQFNNRFGSGTDFILFKLINYYTYWSLLHQLHPFHRAYFLLNPNRIIDRPLYFALKTFSSVHPKLITSKIVDEAIDYNTRLKNSKILSNKIQFQRLQGTKELRLPVCQQVIKNKSITFLQTEIKMQVLQQVVMKLGGQWVRNQDYITKMQVDIVVTNRNTIQDGRRKCEYICENELWKKIFPLPQDQKYHI